MRFFILLLVMALAGGLVYFGLTGMGIDPARLGIDPASWSKISTPAVTTTRVVLRKEGGPIAGGGVLTANGYVVARKNAAVSARSQGLLQSVVVDIGDKIQKGQEIGRLEDAREKVQLQAAKSRLTIAQANLNEAQKGLESAQRELNRQKKLRQQGISTEQAFDTASDQVAQSAARLGSLEAEVGSARVAIEAAEIELEYTIIRAPFDAIVLTKDAEVGEVVAPATMGGVAARGSIVSIASFNELEVEVDVSESYISRIRPGLPGQVIIDAYREHPFRGQVRQIVPAANRQKASVMVKVTILDPDERILPEMSSKVTFLEEALPEKSQEELKSALFVDHRAVRQDQSGPYLFLFQDGKVLTRSIKVGERKGQEVEVVSGANEGDAVVLEGPADLINGAVVRLQE